jgi:hypothetical protein
MLGRGERAFESKPGDLPKIEKPFLKWEAAEMTAKSRPQ